MKVNRRMQDDIAILDMEGTLDLDGANTFKEAISRERQNGCTKLIVNMEKVDSILSTVLNSIKPTVTAFWAPGGKMVLVNLSKGNLRVLEKAPFFAMLSVAKSEDEAIDQLSAQ